MPADSRRVINVSIGLLAAGVLALTGAMAWNAYRELAAANRLVLVNSMSDKLVRCAVLTAVERGFTSSALGKQDIGGETANAPSLARGPRLDPIGETARRKIHELRQEAEISWREALTLAHAVAPNMPRDSDFPRVLDEAIDSYRALDRARQRADTSLQKKGDGIGGPEWFAAATHFIEDTARMRETAFAAGGMPHEISQSDMIVKNSAATMSEYAGIERGTLAFHIAGRRPVPPEKLDELKSYRGVVNHEIRTLSDMQHMPDVGPGIRQSIAAMEQEFVERFGKTRRAVYAAAATGNYPVSADAWMETATVAIDSILAVVTASSEAVEKKVQQLARRNSRQLALYLALAGVAFTLALVAFTRVRKTANALFHEKELAEVTLHSIGDAVITTDAGGRIEYMNPIAETLTGWNTSESKGRPLIEVFRIVDGVTRAAQINPVEKCLREDRIVGLENNTVLISRDGLERVIEDSAAPVRDRAGKIVGAVMVFYDVTLMRNSPHLLSYQATHDALTGLINRREFERQLTRLVESAKTDNQHHVLFYMDLDQFKIINDTCGHIAGDKLLRQLTFLLNKRVRDTDTIARLGGDEFGVLLESCPMEQALQLANDLIRIIHDFRFVWEDATLEIGVSIGVVPITPETTSPVELLSQADAACYAAKDKGRNRVQVYQPKDAEILQRHGEMQWVPRIRHALEENRFVLYCHKILPLRENPDGHYYCETLLRMLDESGAVVPPMAFLPAAERYDLMPAIDRWVVREALKIFGKHCRDNPTVKMNCFINLSGATLSDEHMADYIREQLEVHGMRPETVCFEITETAAVAHFDTAVVFMQKLKKLGCRFALDDFGSGMSSFGYLKNLPVDYLKIAGTFVCNIAINPTDYTMVDAINRVGHVMGIKTIAEFVKDDAILEKLRELGVDYAQGFGIAMPGPMTQHLSSGTNGCCAVPGSPEKPSP
ncbi:MAG: EAL domain-containing protein [Gammaproteobacteria bacterium]|nr:EAL domain-containing protein [Gammaproteobacteria bacterium]